MPAPFVFGVRDFASTVPESALRPGRDSRDRCPFHPRLRLSAFPGAHLPSVAGACGQSHSSQRCDKPTSRNLLVRQTDRVFDTRARTPPGPLLRHRAGSRSCGRPAGKRCGCAAPPELDRHRDRPRACAPRRRRRSLRWPGCYRRSAASESLDRIRGLRLGQP